MAGAGTIAFASCIQKGTPIGYLCPFAIKDSIPSNLPEQIQ